MFTVLLDRLSHIIEVHSVRKELGGRAIGPATQGIGMSDMKFLSTYVGNPLFGPLTPDPKVVLADYLLKTFGRQAVRNDENVGSIAWNPNVLKRAHISLTIFHSPGVFVSLTKAVCALSVM